MHLGDLIGKKAVRTKPLTRKEYQSSSTFGLGGSYVELPDTKWCTTPVLIKAIENEVVYIQWQPPLSNTVYKEILEPKYIDEYWAPVNEEHL